MPPALVSPPSCDPAACRQAPSCRGLSAASVPSSPPLQAVCAPIISSLYGAATAAGGGGGLGATGAMGGKSSLLCALGTTLMLPACSRAYRGGPPAANTHRICNAAGPCRSLACRGGSTHTALQAGLMPAGGAHCRSAGHVSLARPCTDVTLLAGMGGMAGMAGMAGMGSMAGMGGMGGMGGFGGGMGGAGEPTA